MERNARRWLTCGEQLHADRSQKFSQWAEEGTTQIRECWRATTSPALALKSREQEGACSGRKLSNEAYAPAGRCLRLSTQASYERCRASAVRLFESLVTACREDDWSVPTGGRRSTVPITGASSMPSAYAIEAKRCSRHMRSIIRCCRRLSTA